MAEAQSALPGATYDGFVRVSESGLRGMITLRGDLGSEQMLKAVKSVCKCTIPAATQSNAAGDYRVLWMSPDELLIMCNYADVAATELALGKALKGTHHLIANVSDARATFVVYGAKARDVLGKLTPANISPDAFAPGQVRRSRLAQVAAAFWVLDEETIEVVCFRSVADYVYGLLSTSAVPGSEVT